MNKSIYNFKIERLDGTVIDLNEAGIWVESFRIHALSTVHESEKVPGLPGEVPISSEVNSRIINVSMQADSPNFLYFDEMRDRIFEIFRSDEEFYVIRDLQPGKRIKVLTPGGFDIDYNTNEDGYFNVQFIAFYPYFETRLFKTNSSQDAKFQFKNDGNREIDMRHQEETEIEFRGASQNLTIRNKTTGEEWRYNGSSAASDVILLKGARSTKNGSSIFGQTNRKLIGFVPGWNDIEIEGATGEFTLTIRTRFYFL